MQSIFDAITEWLKGLLVEGIMGNLGGLFTGVNEQVGEIAAQVGMTPAAWNAGVFSMIRQLSETVILPIAGLVLTFVMTYELIQMLIDHNNLHTETELPSINIASIRFQGQYHEIGIYFDKLYRIVQNKADGAPITCYHSLDFCEIADIEVCIPISKKLKSHEVITRKIPCSRALCVKYIGEYNGLKFAYKALFDYANKNNLTYHAPIIEIYQKGYGTTMAGNPEKYETDIYLPLRP